MTVTTGTKRARTEDDLSPVKSRSLPKLPSVGDWVVVKAASRRSVDQLKAKTPCLVTLVDGGRVQVLYPNQLSVFLHQQDGEVSVRFRTEACALVDVRAYKGEAASCLDRKMIVTLCSSISNASATATRAGPPAPVANPPEQECSRGDDWLLGFTARTARAFRAEGREVLDQAALQTFLADEYSAEEVEKGLAALDKMNKVMIADNAVFLVA